MVGHDPGGEVDQLGWLQCDAQQEGVVPLARIVPEDLHLFKEHKVKSFIAGRALAADNGAEIARAFHQAIAKNWA